jgi:hypothetical protein
MGMSYETLAFAVLLECVRAGDWATAAALTAAIEERDDEDREAENGD